ncbi:hypothetical protein EPN96_12690 [bacterium]|nr:MAG: hypothetical protein EPN96_12690 [bacterium]
MKKTTASGGAPEDLATIQQRFNAAMARFNSRKSYRWFGIAVATANVSLQALLLWRLREIHLTIGAWIGALLVAYVLTDFINGLVHMYMDANDRYDSFAGPLIANFHLHHRTPLYTSRSLPVVYFMESGSKVWLVPCLAAVLWLSASGHLGPWLAHVLVFTGVLSSVAEVSHYLCHTSNSPVARVLGNSGILLSKRHHAAHHLKDNVRYAFLNGLTDPLLDLIAAKLSPGYKNHTDLHYAAYETSENSR